MNELVINKVNVTELLQNKLSRLKKGWIALLQTPVKNSMDVNLEAVKLLQKNGYKGVYITLSTSYSELSQIMEAEGLNKDDLYFIDGVSQMHGSKKVDSENVSYVHGPLSVDAITEKVNNFVEEIEDEDKFVFLDSITTILLYNSMDETVKFSKFLTESLREKGVLGIMVSVSRGMTNKDLIDELNEVSDEIIDITEK